MVDVVMSQKRVLRSLLDGYSVQIWFGVTHKKTFIRPTCVPESTFKMKPLEFQIDEIAFDTEVCSWRTVAMEVRSGVYTYIFDGMLPNPFLRETLEQTVTRMAQLQLSSIIEQLNTKV